MKFSEWEPIYETILDDFGFGRADDERARDVLASLLADSVTCSLDEFDIEGETVAIAGAGPNLEGERDVAAGADTVLAASSAASRLHDAGIDVDCIVTDLDGTPERTVELAETGVPVALHAHGDNVPLLQEHVPKFRTDRVVPTTQAAPTGPVCNVGGFTDGDRAAFLADHLGAGRLVFLGWALDDPSVGPMKRRKLAWAERLLALLEQRRDERFALLDGRRDDIEMLYSNN